MIIQFIQALGCGNAVRLTVSPTYGEKRWRILRKETNAFTGQDDPSAYLVYDGDGGAATDSRLLVNGTPYYYAVYGLTAPGVWSAPHIASCTPQANFTDASTDAQEFVRERLDVALSSMISRGLLALSKPSIPVISIPFYSQGIELPVVTVLFNHGASTERFLGEEICDVLGSDGFTEVQGWLSNVSLEVSVWSLNAQERNVLRRALVTSIAANLDIFADYGLDLFEVQSVNDSEDTQSMNAPVYQTTMQIGCLVTVAAVEEYGMIRDVIVGASNGSGGASGGAGSGGNANGAALPSCCS